MGKSIIITLALILAIVISYIIYPLAFYVLMGILLLILLISLVSKLSKSSSAGKSSSGSGKWSPKETGYGREKGRVIAQQGYVKYYFKESSKWTFILFFIGIIVFGGWFVYYTGYYKIGTAQAEAMGISSANLKTLFSPSYWQSKLSEYGSFKNPESTEQVVKKGVIFSTPESLRPFYNLNDKIQISGDVHIDAIQDPTTQETMSTKVTFSCMDDEKNIGQILIYGVSEDLQEKQEVSVNENMDIRFRCEMDAKASTNVKGNVEKSCEEQQSIPCNKGDKNKRCNGEWVVSSDYDYCCKGSCVDATTGEKVVSTGSELSKKVINSEIGHKIIYINAEYKDFVTKSDLKICSVSRGELIKNKDKYEKKEENTQCVNGCGLTRLGIRTSNQPLSEDVTDPLIIGLVNDADWYGKISKINSIDIDKPNNIEFEGNCKESINQQINVVNDQINKSNEEKPRLNPFQCDFKLTQVEDKLKCSIIEISAKYDYIIKTSTVVEIVNKEKV